MAKASKGRAALSLARDLYPPAVLWAAAAALEERARVTLRQSGGKATRVEIIPRGRASEAALRALAGDFLNEALASLYQAKVDALESPLSAPVADRVLRRGFFSAPKDPLEEMDPALASSRRKETRRLLAEARG